MTDQPQAINTNAILREYCPTKGVLDHGFVRLVESMGSDLSIVRNARVSYNADWRAGENEGSDIRLINYLMRNHHTTPFESVVFTFDIKAPIFVVRQWHRHRTWSYNEVSARYKELPEEFYIPDIKIVGTQSKSNKQMRELSSDEQFSDEVNRDLFVRTLARQSEAAFLHYRRALELNIPRELARCFLPLNTYTHFFGTVNLHNLFHFLELRLHPHAQWEIQQYATAICMLIRPIVPVAYNAWLQTISEETAQCLFDNAIAQEV